MRSSELKAKAKELLMGKKKNAAIMLVVFFIISAILGSVLNAILPGKASIVDIAGTPVEVKTTNPLASIISSFVSIFLSLGMTSYFMKIARGEEPELTELFSKGNILLKVFVTSILVGLVVFGGTLLLVIPGIILAFGYTVVYYIYIDNPEIGITEVMKKSREMMKGHKWQYFCLMFSFIGWCLLLPFTLGLLAFWLIPYMGVTTALFYDSIKE